jgi:hypothetical protein
MTPAVAGALTDKLMGFEDMAQHQRRNGPMSTAKAGSDFKLGN